jgi:hypothetical protein
MSTFSTGLSKHEKRALRGATATRLDEEPPAKSEKRRLLYSRRQAAELLGGVSERTLKTLEAEGRLKKVRLHRRKGPVFYTHDNLMEVAQGVRADDDDE